MLKVTERISTPFAQQRARLIILLGGLLSYLKVGFSRTGRLFWISLLASLAGCLVTAASSLLFSWFMEEALAARILSVALLNGGGTALGLFCAWQVWSFFWPLKQPWPVIFFVVCGIAITLGVLFIHFLAYLPFHAQWHAPPLTITWAYQMLYTAASVVAVFATRGIFYLVPFGWIAPLWASWLLSRNWQVR